IAESTVIPAQMDPGSFLLSRAGENTWQLDNQLSLQAYNTASGVTDLHFQAVVRPASNPLRYLRAYPELSEGVLYAGYEQVSTLSQEKADPIMSCSWNVIQLKPPGQIIIPISPIFEVSDYETQLVDDTYQIVHDNYLSLRITGERTYKTGYKAAHLTGRFGYYQESGTDQAVLLVRNYYNNPSSDYFEEAYNRPGEWGSSLFVYNDGGSYGGYGEIECFGQTIGGPDGRTTSVDPMQAWLFSGRTASIRKIALHLLSVRL
ncbi:MAG: hypothetical protein IH586_16330, partial [Anaerolineaceae bacterium]|nr:hypothetical protein [Anaerolineaceae bacterium]